MLFALFLPATWQQKPELQTLSLFLMPYAIMD